MPNRFGHFSANATKQQMLSKGWKQKSYLRLVSRPLQRIAYEIRNEAKRIIKHRSYRHMPGKMVPTMRRKHRANPPGGPPFSRSHSKPMKMIHFAPYMRSSRKLRTDGGPNIWIIGPVGFGSDNPVPAVHEHGREAMMRYGVRGKPRKMARYPKRPFMAPARDKVFGKLPSMWRRGRG